LLTITPIGRLNDLCKKKSGKLKFKKKGARQVASATSGLRLATRGDRTPNRAPVKARSRESEQKKEKKMLNESKKNRREN
jgi:hypothetical protein